MALVFLGSSGLTWFDAALIGYGFFGVVYRDTVWLQPLRRLGSTAAAGSCCGSRGRVAVNLTALPGLAVSKLFVQDFIFKRSKVRWLAHQLIFWGCVIAALSPSR